ncbi:MAG: PAS domain S-box protein [Deltaproteobacteria bacterium]|nr:PAS domain S-box protein [Deltaproteobacteria bacterium]
MLSFPRPGSRIKATAQTETNDPEQIRRRRERYLIIFTAIVIVALTLLESYFSKTRGQIPITNNILVYFLLNVNILLLTFLVFLVIRNLVKLFFERRRGILGSKLRMKLVASFVALSIIPTLLLFWISASFIVNTIDNWFSFQMEESLEESLEVAQTYYEDLSNNALFFARDISHAVIKNNLTSSTHNPQLQKFIEAKQGEYHVGAIEIFSVSPHPRSIAVTAMVSANIALDPGSPLVKEGLAGNELTKVQSLGNSDVIRGIVPIHTPRSRQKPQGLVVVSYYVPQSLVKKMSRISNAFSDYKRLQLTQWPIKITYIIFLSIVTLLIILSAIMFGFHLAKNITGPIKDLAEGTAQVANGNLDVHIDASKADDEIGSLVASFNKMTHDLKTGQEQLKQINKNLKDTNIELDQRRTYMEIILKNVAAGVISLDNRGRITTINKSVGKILGLKVESVLNKNYRDILPPRYLQQVESLLQEIDRSSSFTFEKEIELPLPTKTLHLTTYITPLRDERENYLGLVIVVEDVTELQKAQRIAAWREVAQRIAHEIKNPLTPIQLSAQRLRRRYQDKFVDDGQVFNECTHTIITQVELLKNMVNEFYRFARMPSTKPSPHNLNKIIAETLPVYREAHRKITFYFDAASTLPVLNLDKNQIKRACINLLDNAVAALENNGTISIRTFYEPKQNMAGVEIADDGCGIPSEISARLFEPYFSTKKSGTGLGLTIVNSIVTNHHGYVRVKNNKPKGTVFRIELPVET